MSNFQECLKLTRKLWRIPYISYHGRVNRTAKQGSMLMDLIHKGKDKRKHWHLTAFAEATNKGKGVFSMISKPSRRQSTLNSLFIRNITDVLSTGDIAPDLMGTGIEITGVKVTQDFQLLNVYWQIPLSKYHLSEEIHNMLNLKAPKIRSELISRNVLGRVPRIFFIRDPSNAQDAALEEAFSKADTGPVENAHVIPEGDFLKNLYSFENEKELRKTVETPKKSLSQRNNCDRIAPERPPDMKTNIFGLNHETLMKQVMISKKKANQPKQEAFPSSDESEDLFSKIPGSGFQSHKEREQLLKQFCVERKKLRSLKGKSVTQDEEVTVLDDNDEIDESLQVDDDFSDLEGDDIEHEIK